MATDTFAEVVRWLERKADGAKACGLQDNHIKYLKAARLLAAAGEEVRAWRDNVGNYEGDKLEYGTNELARLQKAVNTLNALAPELKEIA